MVLDRITGTRVAFHTHQTWALALNMLDDNRLETVARIWTDAGFDVNAFANIEQLIWEKFICNVAYSGPCTVLGCTLGELMSDAGAWETALAAGQEAYSLGRAMNVGFSFEDPVAYIIAFGAKMPDARPSMLLDHLASRPSEVDAINGMVPVLGRKLALPTPVNDTLSAIIRFREARFDTGGEATA